MPNESTNKDSKIVPTQRGLLTGIAAKHYTRQHLLPHDVVMAYERGMVHYHDLGCSPFSPMFNCALINLRGMLIQGFKMSNAGIGLLRSTSIATAMTAQIIIQVVSHVYGGTTINHIGEVLMPFITGNFKKHRKIVEGWWIPDAGGCARTRVEKEYYDAF